MTSQSIYNGELNAIFDEDSRYTPRPAIGWWLASDHDQFMDYVEKERSEGRHVFSLACDDDLGFGVFTLEGVGTDQGVTWDSDMSSVQEWLDEGYRITACGARNSRFYYVMTRGAMEYEGKSQTCITRSTWGEAVQFIEEMYKEGERITGICYSTGLEKYLVIMTESSESGQCSMWGNEGISEWMAEQYSKRHDPTIIFTDPRSQKNLVVMTSDNDRSGYRKLHITLRK